MLAMTGGVALGGLGLSSTTARSRATSTDKSVTIMDGTEHETTGYVQTGSSDGPTVMIVGGIHGNEVAGYKAASKLSDLSIERGRLVTVPRANVVAIENGSRSPPGGVDLNRQFPVGEEPTPAASDRLSSTHPATPPARTHGGRSTTSIQTTSVIRRTISRPLPSPTRTANSRGSSSTRSTGTATPSPSSSKPSSQTSNSPRASSGTSRPCGVSDGGLFDGSWTDAGNRDSDDWNDSEFLER